MKISQASVSDKKSVLNFCKNTFSWGDYISDVWDYWIKEGNLFAAYENGTPIAICHTSFFPLGNQIWIEGIRVNQKFRRKGIGESLVKEAEKKGRNNKCKNSFMLIANTNKKSLLLAKKLDYKIFQTWTFFSLNPQKNKTNEPITYAKSQKEIMKYLLPKNLFYVKSWRWYPLNKHTISQLVKNDQIIYEQRQKNKVLAVVSDSEHFSSTMLITLIEGSPLGIKKFLKFIQNYGYEKKYKRLQVLTRQKSLPDINGLQKRITFQLMKKEL